MTSLYSNKELLYCMPASGALVTAPGAVSAILTGNTATNPAFKMPSARSLWGMSEIPGRALRISMRGSFGTPASTPGTWLLGVGLNTTQATKPATIVLAATGAYTPAAPNLGLAATAGYWEMEFDVVFQTAGSAAGAAPVSNLAVVGNANMAPGNNAATGATPGGLAVGVGSGAAIVIDPTVEYWVEGYATFSTGPASTNIQCNQFLVSAQN
jgi:hypothetical protein